MGKEVSGERSCDVIKLQIRSETRSYMMIGY